MNQCFFIGNLVANAAQKNANGNFFITFTIAVNRKYKDKETVLFVECIKNGDNANLLPYLQKGKKVAVCGRVSCHAYTDNQGQPRAYLDLSVFELELVSSSNTTQSPQQTAVQAQTPSNPFPTSQQSDGLPF